MGFKWLAHWGGGLKHLFGGNSTPPIGPIASDPATRALLARLQDALDRYQVWRQPLVQFQSEHMHKVNRDGYTWRMFKEELARLNASLRAVHDPGPGLMALFIELCDLFLVSDETVRRDLRAFAAQRRELSDHLLTVANYNASEIKSSADLTPLRRGLAAISIENCALDFRDDLIALAQLYVGAEEAGIDPRPHFEFVAELSDDRPTPGGFESTAKMLRELERCAVVAERRSKGRKWLAGG